MKENIKIRKEIKQAITLLLKKLKEWKKYKPVRGYIEDFFSKYVNKNLICIKYTNMQ